MPRTDIVDLSHWQSNVNFEQLAKAGIVGVIHKATEGTSYVDPTYAKRMDPCLAAGITWGAYHFLKHGSVAKQMEHFARNCGLPDYSRAVIDYEDAACTLGDLQEALEWLNSEVRFEVCVYAGGLLKGQVGSKSYPWLEPYPLWLAQYGPTPSWPTQIWKTYSLWQWTDTGQISGVAGNCDLNEFNGSKTNAALWMGPAAPVPVPDPGTKEITIDIQVPDGIDVRVFINGEPQ